VIVFYFNVKILNFRLTVRYNLRCGTLPFFCFSFWFSFILGLAFWLIFIVISNDFKYFLFKSIDLPCLPILVLVWYCYWCITVFKVMFCVNLEIIDWYDAESLWVYYPDGTIYLSYVFVDLDYCFILSHEWSLFHPDSFFWSIPSWHSMWLIRLFSTWSISEDLRNNFFYLLVRNFTI